MASSLTKVHDKQSQVLETACAKCHNDKLDAFFVCLMLHVPLQCIVPARQVASVLCAASSTVHADSHQLPNAEHQCIQCAA